MLTASPDSDIPLFPSDQWPTAHADGKVFRLVKHSQWVVLNRGHAKIIAKHWLSRDEFRINVRGGHGQQIMLQRSDFAPKMGEGSCLDEEAVAEMICGAIELDPGSAGAPVKLHCPGLGSFQYPFGGPQGRPRTLVVWGGLGSQGQLASALLGDTGSSIQMAHGSHPALFENMSEPLAMALRNSQYLFARKFLQQAYTPDRVAILISEVDPLMASSQQHLKEGADTSAGPHGVDYS
jgi:hypothetical protein